MSDRNWFVDHYDALGDDVPEGAELEKLRDSVAHGYADGVESGDIARHHDDLVSEGRALFDRWVKPTREQRKSSLRRDAAYLGDCLAGGTILGTDEPVLMQMFPLGDGRDKTLRNWSPEDWRNAARERFRNAADVTAAAADFDEHAERMAKAIESARVVTTGDLFGGHTPTAA